MPIVYDPEKLTPEQREATKQQYVDATVKMLAEKGIKHDVPDHVSLGTEQVWVRVWLLVDTKEKDSGKEKAVAGNPPPA